MFLISVYLNVLEKTFRRPPGSDLLSHRSVNFPSRLCIFVSLSPTPVIPVLDNLSTGSSPCLPSPRPSALSILSISTTAPRTEVWLPLRTQAGPWAARPPHSSLHCELFYCADTSSSLSLFSLYPSALTPS